MSVQSLAIPFPEAADLHLRLTVGACKLRLGPGGDAGWVSGTYDDPSDALPLRIDQTGGELRISQNLIWPESWGKVDRPPTFDLRLGADRPFTLSLELGANEGDVDLGGLPLVGALKINQGAGKLVIRFSSPNPQSLQNVFVGAGAAGLELMQLGNANFAAMKVEGGAAAVNLDFAGAWSQPAQVQISVGMSSVVLALPASLPAQITTQTVLGSVEIGDGFMKKAGVFFNEAALAAAAPTLSVAASVAMGSIKLIPV